jgi:hypothetical protein
MELAIGQLLKAYRWLGTSFGARSLHRCSYCRTIIFRVAVPDFVGNWTKRLPRGRVEGRLGYHTGIHLRPFIDIWH